MEPLNIEYQNKVYKVAPLTNTLEFIAQMGISIKDPVAVVINGHLGRLNKKFKVDSSLNIIERSSFQGRKIYESSVLFMFRVAFNKLFPNCSLFIQHSLHAGVYAEVKDMELSEENINEIENLMKNMVTKGLDISRKTRDWDISMEEFANLGRKDLLHLYKYYSPTIYKYYELDGVEESLYLPQLPNTKYLQFFKLQKYHEGVIVIIPDFFNGDNKIPDFIDRPKLFDTYREYHAWSRILKVRMVGQLNRYIMNDEIQQLIMVAEALHEKKMAQIADSITKKEIMPRLILIAGPSSSGKTTFSKRIGIQLKVNGINPVSINLDNYFVDREKTPKDEFGNYDFESIDAINVELFNQHLADLLAGKEVEIPRFDFHTGMQKRVGTKLQITDDQVLIIEGIHGLNPKLTMAIDDKFKYKIYISALTQLNVHRHDRIPASDTRLLRRIVRDSNFRGYSATETLERWQSVRVGETKNIFPLQETADVIFNSALFYELSVLKGHAERELRRVEKKEPTYPEARRLLKFLSFFLPIEEKVIPRTSILREFIGDSSFDY